MGVTVASGKFGDLSVAQVEILKILACGGELICCYDNRLAVIYTRSRHGQSVPSEYLTLKSLLQRKLVEPERRPLPSVSIYCITDKGRGALGAWAE